MKTASLLATAVLLAANPLQLGDTAHRSQYEQNDAENLQNLARRGIEPQATPVVEGGPAPNFSFQLPDGRWRHLHDLLGQGAVLLTFGPRDEQLTGLERERERLLDLGVLPVAVIDGSSRAARSKIEHLGLSYTVIPDLRAVIAEQFNTLDPSTHHPMPCWFVVDRKGRVRALDRTRLPAQGFVTIAARALQRPGPGSTVPTSH